MTIAAVSAKPNAPDVPVRFGPNRPPYGGFADRPLSSQIAALPGDRQG